MTDGSAVHRPTGRPAVVVGVAKPEWVSKDFVRIQGGWIYSDFGAVGRRFTVSLHEGRWLIDTERVLWVA
jgi:hypothetical protein